MFSQHYDEYRDYHEPTMLEPQEDFNCYPNSTGSGLIYNASMKLLNDEDSSDHYFQERYSFNPQLYNWRSLRKTSTSLSAEDNAVYKLEPISPDCSSEDGSTRLKNYQSTGQHSYSREKIHSMYKNNSCYLDQGYHSCSSPEIAATELFSDLEELSFEELRAFPVMSAMEVDFLYQEQRQLGQSTVGARPCLNSSLVFPRRIRQQRKAGKVRRSAGSSATCTKSISASSTASKQHQLLWQFLYVAASEPRFKEAIEMEDDGRHDTFAIKDKRRFEEAWATFKGSAKKVPYEYITRNMRHLYRSPHHFLSKVVGQQHKYRFLFHNIEHCYGPNWRQAVAIASRNLLPDSTINSSFDSTQGICERSRLITSASFDPRRNSVDATDDNL